MLEDTNQRSHVEVVSSLVGCDAHILAGNPADRITLGYSSNAQGHLLHVVLLQHCMRGCELDSCASFTCFMGKVH